MTSADFLSPLSVRISSGQYLFFPFGPSSSTSSGLLELGFVFPSILARHWLPHYSFVFLWSKVCFRFFRASLSGFTLTFSFGWPNAPVGNFHPARPDTCRAH